MTRLVLLLVCVLAGCKPYERVVSYDPPLAHLPGAQTQTPARAKPNPAVAGAPAGGRIVIEHEDGTVTLVSRNALQMLTHIRRLVAQDEEELFTQQILSERTKREFLERGFDPAEAFKEIKRREDDLLALLARMPMGEFTPGLYLETLGPNTFRLALYGKAAQDLNWTSVDIVIENGVWRLRWFG